MSDDSYKKSLPIKYDPDRASQRQAREDVMKQVMDDVHQWGSGYVKVVQDSDGEVRFERVSPSVFKERRSV